MVSSFILPYLYLHQIRQQSDGGARRREALDILVRPRPVVPLEPRSHRRIRFRRGDGRPQFRIFVRLIA